MAVTEGELRTVAQQLGVAHHQTDRGTCWYCHVEWPCATHRLIEAHREALGLLKRWQEFDGKESLVYWNADVEAFLAPPQPEVQEVGSE